MKVLRRRNLVAATDRKSIDAEFIAETKWPMFWVEASAFFVATKHRGLLCAKLQTQKGEKDANWNSTSPILFTLHLRGFVIVTGTILSASKSGFMFNIGISFSKRDRSNGLESATKFAGSILNLENFNERDLPEGMAFDFLVPGIKISASLPALFVNLM